MRVLRRWTLQVAEVDVPVLIGCELEASSPARQLPLQPSEDANGLVVWEAGDDGPVQPHPYHVACEDDLRCEQYASPIRRWQGTFGFEGLPEVPHVAGQGFSIVEPQRDGELMGRLGGASPVEHCRSQELSFVIVKCEGNGLASHAAILPAFDTSAHRQLRTFLNAADPCVLGTWGPRGGNTLFVSMVAIVGSVRILGLLAVLAGQVLSLVGGHISLLTPGLLLLALARTGTRGPIGYIDWTVGAVGIALLLLSAMQPMYWLMPSEQLLAGGLVACLSRLWGASELAVCLLVLPGPWVTITSIGALLWIGDSLPGPHGPAELVFTLASLYGPIAAVALLSSWGLRRRRVKAAHGEATLTLA